jgi:hypothetical protein
LRGRNNRTTNDIGNISEAAIITHFLQLGYVVLLPHGKKQRYDLIIEDADGRFWRVQCKTARIQCNGSIITFNTANHNFALKTKKWRHYRGQCDFFAVYWEEFHKFYLLPVDQVGKVQAKLRLMPTRNNQEKNVRWASNYEF